MHVHARARKLNNDSAVLPRQQLSTAYANCSALLWMHYVLARLYLCECIEIVLTNVRDMTINQVHMTYLKSVLGVVSMKMNLLLFCIQSIAFLLIYYTTSHNTLKFVTV